MATTQAAIKQWPFRCTTCGSFGVAPVHRADCSKPVNVGTGVYAETNPKIRGQ